MKVKCEITLELDTGDFELEVHNLSDPGEAIDYDRLIRILKRVLDKWGESHYPDSQ